MVMISRVAMASPCINQRYYRKIILPAGLIVNNIADIIHAVYNAASREEDIDAYSHRSPGHWRVGWLAGAGRAGGNPGPAAWLARRPVGQSRPCGLRGVPPYRRSQFLRGRPATAALCSLQWHLPGRTGRSRGPRSAWTWSSAGLARATLPAGPGPLLPGLGLRRRQLLPDPLSRFAPSVRAAQPPPADHRDTGRVSPVSYTHLRA